MQTKHAQLHERAMSITTTHRKSEAALISVVQEIDATKTFLEYGARSLFDYCERVLKLSEGTSYNLITVARRANEVPALKRAVESGHITVSKARKIAPVLTKENQDAWLELASTKSSREIERAVADANPQLAQAERYQFLSSDVTRATLDIPEALMKKLRRIQDLESQRASRHATMVEVLEAMADEYIERNDPVVKAERAVKRVERRKTANFPANPTGTDAGDVAVVGSKGSRQLVPGRIHRNIPSAVRHAVFFRDRGQCTYEDKYGRCQNTRWLEVHHLLPKREGGADIPENLVLVCSTHHALVHNGSAVRAPQAKYCA